MPLVTSYELVSYNGTNQILVKVETGEAGTTKTAVAAFFDQALAAFVLSQLDTTTVSE